MIEPPPVHPEIVIVDAPCTNCGYSLRGLLIDSVCPECAHPVRRSLERRRLGLASPEYLRSLQTGSGVLLLGLVLAVVFGGIGALQYTTLGTFRYAVPLVVWPSLDLTAAMFVGVGVWKLTIDDPGLPPYDQARGNARTLRAAAIALPIVHAVQVLAATLSVAPLAATIALPVPLLDAASFLLRVMFVVAAWLFIATGLCNLLRWFAARLPDPPLYSKAKSSGRMLPFFLVPAMIGPAGLIPAALWLAILVGSAREKIAKAGG
ncbi:MAG: hypothetical protein K2Y21_03955 [Phycisphaerales bacterium]|nr:hypothetical protein [Phycisphaerales bacterium]